MRLKNYAMRLKSYALRLLRLIVAVPIFVVVAFSMMTLFLASAVLGTGARPK